MQNKINIMFELDLHSPSSRQVRGLGTLQAKLAGPKHVSTMIDTDHVHDVITVVDPVDHAVGSAPGGMVAGKIAGKGLADPVGAVQERAGEELADCHGDRQRQPGWRGFGEGTASGRSRVSSSDSKSDTAMSTASGRPLRVMTTRSWVARTSSSTADSRALASANGIVVMTRITVCQDRPGNAGIPTSMHTATATGGHIDPRTSSHPGPNGPSPTSTRSESSADSPLDD